MSPRQAVLPLLLVLAACGEDEGAASALISAEALVFVGDADPSSGPVTLMVRFTNSGDAEAKLSALRLPEQAPAAGAFSTSFTLPGKLAAGQSLTVPVTFTPAAGGPAGCALAALSSLTLEYIAAPRQPRAALVSLLVAGACEDALRCAPAPIQIAETVLGESTRQEVTCVNAGMAAVTISAAALSDDLDGQLKLESSGLVRSVGRGELATGALVFAPTTRGAYTSSLTITADKAITLPIAASARRVRPLCSDPAPAPPALPADIDRYTFKLESEQLASYGGEVRSLSGVSEQYAPMIDSAMLLATGSYLDEFCKISHSGGTWRWEGLPCQQGEGTLFNVMPIALSAQIEAELASVKVGDQVRVEGFDIERVEREGFWNDGGSSAREGNHAMFVSRVCDLVE